MKTRGSGAKGKKYEDAGKRGGGGKEMKTRGSGAEGKKYEDAGKRCGGKEM